MIIFLTHDIKNFIYYLSFLSFLTFFAIKRFFPNVIQCFTLWCISDVTSEIQSSDVMFNVGCELSQPMGKTEFSSKAKNRTNSVS